MPNTNPEVATSREREADPHAGAPAGLDSGAVAPPDSGLGEYLRATYRRRWLAVATLLLVATPIIVWTWWQAPVYESQVRLLLDPAPDGPAPFADTAREQGMSDLFDTRQEMIRSRALALRAITRLRLWEHGEFADLVDDAMPAGSVRAQRTDPTAPPGPDAARAIPDIAAASSVDLDPRAERLVGEFLRRVRTGSVPLTRVVNISFEARDPQLAADGANALADAFIAQDLETRFTSARQAAEWLEARLTDQRLKVEESEAALQQYREQPDASAVGNPQNIVSQRLSDLSAAVTRARTERLLKEAAFRQLEAAEASGGLDAIPAIAANAVVQQLRTQEGELERQAAELSQRYGERHPEMVKVRTALEQTRQRRRAEIAKAVEVVRNEHEAALASERSLSGALEAQKAASLQLSRRELEFGRLQREAQTNQQIFDTLLQQARQVGITSELKQSAVRVLDRAQVPGTPVRPDKLQNSVLALAIGLLAAAGTVFGREYLDSRLKTPDDVRRYLRLPFIGIVPDVPRGANNGGPTFMTASHLGFPEALRRVRTYLMLQRPRPGVQTLLLTSTGPQEGKTTLCVGLARALAAAGQRVLLVDADLRRPTVHEHLGLERRPGLADFLTSTAEIAEVVRPTDSTLLSVVTAGSHTAASAELLMSPAMAGLLELQESAFDWIIVDSPPALSASDASLLARLATGVLFVVGADMPPRASAWRAVEQLMQSRARFAGAVLNRAAVDRHSHYYAPYYNQKYESYYATPGDE